MQQLLDNLEQLLGSWEAESADCQRDGMEISAETLSRCREEVRQMVNRHLVRKQAELELLPKPRQRRKNAPPDPPMTPWP